MNQGNFTTQGGNDLKYAVDIVLCVDATLSMRPTLEKVKHSAMTFPTRLAQEMAKKGRGISSLRLKVIAFRDYADNPTDAMSESAFFQIPEHIDHFERAVRDLRAEGGGDIPESGLEALALAVGSPWRKDLDRRRHVIVVFTDAPAHPLGDPRHSKVATYPESTPNSLEHLFEQWGTAQSHNAVMENSAKRLLIFAPEEYPWNDVSDDWNNTIFFPSEAGAGLEEWEMDQIIATIANSL